SVGARSGGPSWCGTGKSLQGVLDSISTGDTGSKLIQLEAGVHRNYSSGKTVPQINHNDCGERSYSTSFLVQGLQNLTITAKPGVLRRDVALLGDHVHTLAIVDAHRIVVRGISLVSNGGVDENGIGDASLAVHDSTGLLEDTIITLNRTRSNGAVPAYCWPDASDPCTIPDYSDPDDGIANADQEGIQLSGAGTYFEVVHNLIADNIHNGIIAIDGAKAFVVGNAIYHNGRREDDFMAHGSSAGKGHGINFFHDFGEQQCCGAGNYYDGNFALKAWNNLIYENSGSGVTLNGNWPVTGIPLAEAFYAAGYSGWASNFAPVLSHNTIVANAGDGIRLGNAWSYRPDPGDPDLNHIEIFPGVSFHVASNNVVQNGVGTGRKGFVIDDIGSWIDSGALVKVYNDNLYQNPWSWPSRVSSKVQWTSNRSTNPGNSSTWFDWYDVPAGHVLATAGYNNSEVGAWDGSDIGEPPWWAFADDEFARTWDDPEATSATSYELQHLAAVVSGAQRLTHRLLPTL
ncbi:MAG: right-handed parallel beta-helix repeat-containing protein, partial [Myxococcales bacterium]|nr:right-handed parallel beta-helix repeat-containing protein [Myxococcales bacterium]